MIVKGKTEGLTCLIILLLPIISCHNINAVWNDSNYSTEQYVDHGRIIIDSNTDLAAFAVSGDGNSSETPYILEGFRIISPGLPAIDISSTTRYFEIRNCWIEASSSYGILVSVIATGTAEIKDNHIENCNIGIDIGFANDILIDGNTIINSNRAINLQSADDEVISNNAIIGNTYGIYMYGTSESNVIYFNLIMDNSNYGVYLFAGTVNYIHSNSLIFNNGGGTQGFDDGTNNYWYSTTFFTGNYWTDWSGTGSYSIAGSAGKTDPYPRTDYQDFDGDSMTNGWERMNGLNPIVPDGGLDPDGDDFTNLQEFQAQSDPQDPDSDDDAIKDGNDATPTSANGPPTVTWPEEIETIAGTTISTPSYNWEVTSSNAVSMKLWLNEIDQGYSFSPFSWNLNFQEGENNVTVQAYYDFEYNYYVRDFIFEADTTLPVISLLSPDENMFYHSDEIITISVSGEESYYYSWDGAALLETHETTFDLPEGAGDHNLTIRAVDDIGNEIIQSFIFKTDDDKPTAAYPTIADGMILSGQHLITVNPTDGEGSGIQKLEFILGITNQKIDMISPYDWIWDTTEYADGNFFITINIYDNLNNIEEKSFSVRVDNSETEEKSFWEEIGLKTIYGFAGAVGAGLLVALRFAWVKSRNKKVK